MSEPSVKIEVSDDSAVKFLDNLRGHSTHPKVVGIICDTNELNNFLKYIDVLRELSNNYLVSQKSKPFDDLFKVND